LPYVDPSFSRETAHLHSIDTTTGLLIWLDTFLYPNDSGQEALIEDNHKHQRRPRTVSGIGNGPGYRRETLNAMLEAKKGGTLQKFLKGLEKADLTICDEWGYVP